MAAAKSETSRLNEFMEQNVMRWVRLILTHQPDAELVCLATKEDLITDTAKDHVTQALMAKLNEADTTIQTMRRTVKAEAGKGLHDLPVVFTTCSTVASVRAARAQIEELIIKSDQSIVMPDTYSRVLEGIFMIRGSVRESDSMTRMQRVFASLDTLPALLQVDPMVCRLILQTLHDLGDVLWLEDMGIGYFNRTVILDPLLLVDFVRQVLTYKYAAVTIPHADLRSLSTWSQLSNHQQIEAMKRLLQHFGIVYSHSEDGVMAWDSDLIVPALWRLKPSAAEKFQGDLLCLTTVETESEAVRLHWEYHFEFGMPPSLFDQVVATGCECWPWYPAGRWSRLDRVRGQGGDSVSSHGGPRPHDAPTYHPH